MLHDLVGSMIGRNRVVPFSFADRGDPWPTSPATAAEPARSRHDCDAVGAGLIAGTLVATETGWLAAETLQPGDRIVTFDNGMRPLRAVRIATLYTAAAEAPRRIWPLDVPAGALGNRSAMQLLPGQAVLIESDAAETLYGDPFIVVGAGVLEGYKGITRAAPAREITVVTLEFDGDEIVYANGTLLMHCPSPRIETRTTVALTARSSYPRLTDQQGLKLVAAMHHVG